MAWMYLVLGGFLEIGWPIGLKLGWTEEGLRVLWLAFGIACILCSGLFLLMAQKEIPMGTAYAVWTGIGAVGAFVVGITVLGESVTPTRIGAAVLVVSGLVLMELSSGD